LIDSDLWTREVIGMDKQEHTNPPAGSGRRTFLGVLSAALGAVAAALVGVPVIGFVFGIRKRKVHWVDLGPLESFALGQTQTATFVNPLKQPWDGVTAETNVFVRYEGKGDDDQERFLVLSVNCAHLGCPVSWFPQSGLFLCPCHGGVYYSNGDHASGPPPRGLYHCVWRVREGKLEVQAPHYPTLHDTLEQPV
jgi:Rieske Fe-S protein